MAAMACLLALGGVFQWREGRQRKEQAEAKVMEAFSLMRLGRPSDGARARVLVDVALQAEPGLPLARAALAELTARYGKTSFETATDIARQAVASDPQCRECRAVLGYVLMTREWAWEEAGQHLRQVVSREPVQQQWRLWYAQWLSVAGPLDESEREARAAIAMDPARPHGHSLLASILFMQGRSAEAMEEGIASLTLDIRHVPGHQWLQRLYLHTSRDLEALDHRLNSLLAWDGPGVEYAQRFHQQLLGLHKTGGRRAVVAAMLEEVGNPVSIGANRYHRAVWKAWIGDDEGALEELAAGAESKPFHMIYTARDPAFARLRTDPRFREIVRRLGLPVTTAGS